jgi:hypothetical protein
MKFSIRDLLWLTVAVALVAGWWVDRLRLSAENKAVEAEKQNAEKDALDLAHFNAPFSNIDAKRFQELKRKYFRDWDDQR